MYNLYILKHTKHNKTYCGITNNLKRRIRQHNCEIKGGARYTSNNLSDGQWYYYIIVENLDKSSALSIERKMHNKNGKGKTPIEKRINRLIELNIEYKIIENESG